VRTFPQGKAVLRVEGLLSLTALAQLASLDSRAEAAMGTLLAAALGKDGTLLQPAAVARLGADDAAALPKLTEVLLTQHLMRVQTAPGATDTVARLLVQLLLHANSDVRKHAASATQAALGGSGKAAEEVATALLKALRDWVVGTLSTQPPFLTAAVMGIHPISTFPLHRSWSFHMGATHLRVLHDSRSRGVDDARRRTGSRRSGRRTMRRWTLCWPCHRSAWPLPC
jgi:hypothetical protein